MGWRRDARRVITLRDWRSTTSCRSRSSCTRPPRLRNVWTTWHSARKLRQVRWSARRSRRALQLVQDLQGNKLAFASKPVVIATTPLIAKQVVSSLARHDIHIQEASQARDLGLDVSSARKPMRRTMAKRWASWEDEREGVRGSVCGLRSKPLRGSGERGLGRRKLMELRRWVRRHRGSRKRERERREAAQCGGRGRCLTTRNALLHPSADPAVQIPCNLIRQWLLFLEHNHRFRPKIGKIWAKIATAMMTRSLATRWRYVR